jgi:hypothetical protein
LSFEIKIPLLMATRILIGYATTFKYYTFVVEIHLTWMDKKLAFFKDPHLFLQLQWVSNVVLGCLGGG